MALVLHRLRKVHGNSIAQSCTCFTSEGAGVRVTDSVVDISNFADGEFVVVQCQEPENLEWSNKLN